jgi:hypothetical protein
LDEVGEVDPATLVSASPVDDEAEVGGDHRSTRFFVSEFDALGERDLLIGGEQRMPPEIVEEEPHKIRSGARALDRFLRVLSGCDDRSSFS